MEQTAKEKIVFELSNRMTAQGLSQNKVANMIGNCSPATINVMLNGKWKEKQQLISEEMWTRVDSWLATNNNWISVTSDPNYRKITNICHDCQKKSISRAIVGVPGAGKSHAMRAYARNNGNVFYLECAAHWTRKVFLNKLKKAMGLSIEPCSVHDMVDTIMDRLREIQKPLIIIDEADKLSDPVLNFFNCFYNETFERCGFVLAGAPYLEQRIAKGVRLNKQSYRELFSRVGGEFKKIHPAKEEAIREIAKANGITRADELKVVVNKCLAGDLRTVKNEVDNIKLSHA